jgi:hypothetical protein
MTHRRMHSSDGEGFLRATCDSWQDLEHDQNVVLKLGVRPTKRKGVLQFDLGAWRPTGGSRDFPLARVAADYPNSQVQTLEAFLYTLVIKLERVLELQHRFPE